MKRVNWRTDTGIGLIVTTTIFMSVLIWAALNDPPLMIRQWQVYALWVILPYGVGVALWAWGRRVA